MDQPRVFISYRREEAAGHAGRLRDSLCTRFGDGHVFMDLEMAPGIDFVDELSIQLRRCDVVLVLIGRDWIRLRDAHGRPRLANPEDFVRCEIETALAEPDVVVVPILIQGAVMPSLDQLPETMHALARRNALELSDARWSFDVDRLASQLRRKTPAPRPTVAWPWRRAATAFLGGAAVAWLPTWGILTLFVKLPNQSNEVATVIVKGALQRGVAWAVFAAIVAAWATYTARAARLWRAATVAFIIAFVGAGVGGAFTQAMRDKAPSFDTHAAVILGYIILGAGVTFAAVSTAAPEARIRAFVLGLVAGALCGYLRVLFGSHPSGLGQGIEVALQSLAIGSAAFVAVVLSGSKQFAASPTAVPSRARPA
jgi:TIR domain